MSTFDLTVSTLDKQIFQGKVLAAYFPTPQGEVGILFNHATYLTNTLAGTLKCTEKNGSHTDVILPNSGIFSIENNQARLWIV